MGLLIGCASTSSNDAKALSLSGVPPYSSMQLQEGDLIRINFEAATNLNTMQKIQIDGSITLPFIGDVKAAGKTPQELQTDLMKLYESQLKVKELTVTLMTAAANIYVTGAVLKPGKLPLDRALTVLDAVMEAGGFDPNRAKLSDVTVVRMHNGQRITFKVNLKKALKGEEIGLFYLRPYDIVYVPEKTFTL